MTTPAWALQQAVYAALSAAPSLCGGRIFDAVPKASAFPYIVIGDAIETAQGYGVIEHALTLSVWSRGQGMREVKQTGALIAARLDGAVLPLEGQVLIGLSFRSTDYRRQSDGETWRAALHFRAVTETA